MSNSAGRGKGAGKSKGQLAVEMVAKFNFQEKDKEGKNELGKPNVLF